MKRLNLSALTALYILSLIAVFILIFTSSAMLYVSPWFALGYLLLPLPLAIAYEIWNDA